MPGQEQLSGEKGGVFLGMAMSAFISPILSPWSALMPGPEQLGGERGGVLPIVLIENQ